MLYIRGALYIPRKRYQRFFCRAPRILSISDFFAGNLGRYQQIKINFQK